MTSSAFLAVDSRAAPASHDGTDELIDLLRRVPGVVPGEARDEISTIVAAVLRKTASAKVRNAAALALLDMEYPGAAEAIETLLQRQELARTAGTLLFVLDELNAPISLDTVLNIVRNGSYEARAELMIILEKDRLVFANQGERELAKSELSRLAADEDKERAEAAGLALELLRLDVCSSIAFRHLGIPESNRDPAGRLGRSAEED